MDTIADMLIRMKNAGNAGRDRVLIPFSKMKFSVAKLLKEKAFIRDVEAVEKGGKKYLDIKLILENNRPRIRGVKRISKPSVRVYKKLSGIYPVKNGYGLLVLSTSKGIVSDREAKKLGVGGEALFAIW